MCGIAGILERPSAVASREILLAMAGELRHRGPDGTGLYLDGRCGMVNTRLSIVDINGGDQPVSNEDGRYWVVHNGEIYNHIELRQELEALGHRFTSHCDTEVIVHAYEAWGEDCLHRFNGAFAFAIWDSEAGELFLARDRLGIRPLFVAEVEGRLLFASEAKALLRHPALPRGLDPLGILETFILWSTAPDRTAFKGIRELAPGSCLRLDRDGRLLEGVWWDVRFAARPEPVRSEAELSEELLSLLEDATRLRLRADVPVSAYLSGGLDSSAIAALATRVSNASRRFFSLSFVDPHYDERIHQDQMARFLDTELTTLSITARDVAEAFPDVIRFAEKPMFRTAPAPMLLLSRRVRQEGLKVVLTGEGADEVFAGYNLFRENKVRRFWAKQPSSKLRPLLLSTLYPYLKRDLGRTGSFLAGFFSKDLGAVDDPLYSHRLRFSNGARVAGMLHRDVVAEALLGGEPEARLRERLPHGFDGFGPLGQAQYIEIRTFMQGYLLHSQGDRMLMGNSVEGRFPFLDHRLIEFAARVPEPLRMKGLREKYLLRRAVAPLMPSTVAKRDKRPYRAPILQALIGADAPEYVSDLLSEARLQQAGIFEAKRAQRLLLKCQRAQGSSAGVGENDEMALVALLSTMLLNQQFIERPVLAPSAEPRKEVHGTRLVRDSMGDRRHATHA